MSRVFFSYSRTDKAIVDDLILRLEAAGHQIWLDRGGIRGGEQWRQEIVEAIEGNDAFVLVLSKNSTESDHVRAELDVAKEGRRRIIPIDIQPVVIPSSMKYQLAGLQRINMHTDFERGYQELLLSLGEGAAAEASPSTARLASPSRDQSKTRNTAIWVGGIAALLILFILVGYQLTKSRNVPEEVTPQSITQAAPLPQAEVEDALPPAGLDTLTTLEELEPLLQQANIRLSEPEDEERTRSYFTGPASSYRLLAVAVLKAVGEQRFKQYINLDIVDKWYIQAAGAGYAERGPLDPEIVVEALIDAHNDYWGDSATSLEDLLEPAGAVQPTLASSTPTDTAVAIYPAPGDNLPDLDILTSIEEIEPLLLQANIRLSEPEDEERTRSYFTGPNSAYHMLAVATLKVVGERRFTQYINLDIVDKWYTAAVGSGYAGRGPLDLEIVEESLIDAHNDYWGDNATSLEALLEPRS